MASDQKRHSSSFPPGPPRDGIAAGSGRHEMRIEQIELRAQNEELRSALKDLEESRNRFYELYDRAPVAYVTLNRAGQILQCNFTAVEILGVDRAHVVGASFQSFLTEEGADAFHRLADRLLLRREKQSAEVDVVARDGSVVPSRIEAVLVVNKGVASFRCAILGMASEKKPSHPGESRGDVLERFGDAFFVRELDGRVSYLSAACSRVWKMSASELCRASDGWTHTIVPEDRQKVREAYARHRKDLPFDAQYRVLDSGGELRWVHERAFMVESEGGAWHFVGFVRDISAAMASESLPPLSRETA